MVTLFYLRFKIHRFDWKLLNYSAFYAYCCFTSASYTALLGITALTVATVVVFFRMFPQIL